MDIKVYTADGCFYCTQIKKLFERANLKYEEIPVTLKNRSQFNQEYPNARSYPFTIIDGKEYPLIVDVAKFLLKEGLVSATK